MVSKNLCVFELWTKVSLSIGRVKPLTFGEEELNKKIPKTLTKQDRRLWRQEVDSLSCLFVVNLFQIEQLSAKQ